MDLIMSAVGNARKYGLGSDGTFTRYIFKALSWNVMRTQIIASFKILMNIIFYLDLDLFAP